MSGNPAEIWKIQGRGFIRKGYYADVILVKQTEPYSFRDRGINSKCGWSPYENILVDYEIIATFVNGHPVYTSKDGIKDGVGAAMPVNFKN